MENPIATLQRTAAEYQQMSKKDQKRYVTRSEERRVGKECGCV